MVASHLVKTASRKRAFGEVTDDRRGFAFPSPEVVVGAVHDHDLGDTVAASAELAGGAGLVPRSPRGPRRGAPVGARGSSAVGIGGSSGSFGLSGIPNNASACTRSSPNASRSATLAP